MMLRDLRNLPRQVLDRLGELDPTPGFDVVLGQRRFEDRFLAGRVEIRRTDNGDPILDGYATVYETWYDVLGGPPWGWREMFAAGACKKSVAERDDVRLLINHQGLALARIPSGTLRLESDDVGLYVTTPNGIDMRSPDVQSLVSAMERRDVDQMSLAFRATRQEWNDDYTERIVREVRLSDVSIVTYPANQATVAQLREDQPAGFSLTLARAQVEALALRR